MKKTLVVADTSERAAEFAALVKEISDVAACGGDEVFACLNGDDFALVLIVPPLGGTDGAELAKLIAENVPASVALFCRKEKFDLMESKTRGYGIFVLGWPLARQVLGEAVRLMLKASERLATISRDKIVLQGKIEELKLIDRAKFALIRYLKMTENEAHRFIEKQAMDRRVTKLEICENILKTYEI